MQTYYNDNLRLTPAAHAGVWAGVGEISADLGVRSEVSGLSVTPRVRSYRYTGYHGASSYDHVAARVGASTYYQSEANVWQLSGSYDRDSTLTSELLDSGRVEFNVPRERWSVNPAWTSQWSPRSTIQLGGGLSRTSYSNGLAYGLNNYSVVDASAAYGYNLTETQKANLTISASRFRAPAYFDDATDNYVMQVGWTKNWTERTAIDLGGGFRLSRTRFNVFGVPIDNTQKGYVVHGNLTSKSERTTWVADLKRNVVPTSYGVLMQRDSARWSADRRLSLFLSGRFSGLWLHSKTLQSSLEKVNRTLLRLTMSLQWRYAEHWTLRGSYSWTRQDYGQTKASANQVFLSLTYRGLERSVSY